MIFRRGEIPFAGLVRESVADSNIFRPYKNIFQHVSFAQFCGSFFPSDRLSQRVDVAEACLRHEAWFLFNFAVTVVEVFFIFSTANFQRKTITFGSIFDGHDFPYFFFCRMMFRHFSYEGPRLPWLFDVRLEQAVVCREWLAFLLCAADSTHHLLAVHPRPSPRPFRARLIRRARSSSTRRAKRSRRGSSFPRSSTRAWRCSRSSAS